MLSQKPWRIEFVILLIATVLSCMFLGVIAVGLLRQFGVAGFKTPDSLGSVLVATLSFQGITWILIYFFLRLHGLNWREAFGLRNQNLFTSLLWAVVTLLVVLPVVLYLQRLSILVLDRVGWLPEQQRAVDLLNRARSPWLRGYLAFFAVVLAPVAEEFIFRGVLFPFVRQFRWPTGERLVRKLGLPMVAVFIRRRFWKILAWIGVSLLFAAIHVNLPTFVPLFVLALALTWLYEKTDCLFASIMVHSLFNAVNLIFFFLQNR